MKALYALSNALYGGLALHQRNRIAVALTVAILVLVGIEIRQGL